MFAVYVHVPFCLRRCGYCDFNTFTARDLGAGVSRGHYAKMIAQEMRLYRTWQSEHGVAREPVSTIFFGGGTPTVLPAGDLCWLLEQIDDVWGIAPHAEITTEANPDTVDAHYVSSLAVGGFTRISCGMQSAVPRILTILDRTHTPDNVRRLIEAAHEADLRSSVDLIYGAPGETLDEWEESVHSALDLRVCHVSAYALTIEPHTKMGRAIAAGRMPTPDEDYQAAAYELADDMFAAAGLQWYEISNWAVPGHESRHNLGYWSGAQWAGLGPGAHSYAVANADDGVQQRIRAWDIAHPRRWGLSITEQTLPWQDHEIISDHEALEEQIMLGIRLRQGLDLRALLERESQGIAAHMSELVSSGLVVVCDETRLVPTRQGRLLNDALIRMLFDYCGL